MEDISMSEKNINEDLSEDELVEFLKKQTILVDERKSILELE